MFLGVLRQANLETQKKRVRLLRRLLIAPKSPTDVPFIFPAPAPTQSPSASRLNYCRTRHLKRQMVAPGTFPTSSFNRFQPGTSCPETHTQAQGGVERLNPDCHFQTAFFLFAELNDFPPGGESP